MKVGRGAGHEIQRGMKELIERVKPFTHAKLQTAL